MRLAKVLEEHVSMGAVLGRYRESRVVMWLWQCGSHVDAHEAEKGKTGEDLPGQSW